MWYKYKLSCTTNRGKNSSICVQLMYSCIRLLKRVITDEPAL